MNQQDDQRWRQRLREIGEAIERRAKTAEWHEADAVQAEAHLMLDAFAVEFGIGKERREEASEG